MSDATLTANDSTMFRSNAARFLSKVLLAAGVLFLILTGFLGYCAGAKYFAFSWLWSFFYFYTIAAGALFWTMIHHVTNGGWGTVVRRQFENIASLHKVIFLFFIPIIFMAPEIYHWMDKPHALHDEAFLAKQAYFTFPFWPAHGSFFWTRTAIFFAFWIGATSFFRSQSIKQDADGSIVRSTLMQKWSYGFVPAFALSITFSAIDWIKTIDYHWYSTMWGVYIFAGTAGAGLAAAILLLLTLKSRGVLAVVTTEHFHILGKLLLAFTIFWGYIAFGQYMLIWYANIPEETNFFFTRNIGSWNTVAILLVVCRFGIPFLLLLSQAAKTNPWRIGFSAGWILTFHALDLYWIIMPTVQPEGWHPHLVEITAWMGMAAILTSFLIRAVTSVNLYPIRDPRLGESLHAKN
jgi:hypothetical protein